MSQTTLDVAKAYAEEIADLLRLGLAARGLSWASFDDETRRALIAEAVRQYLDGLN